ncbi:hypothetical protein [Vibrio tapetis]|uniref:Uncharacterized protein n=1 Tax=Vibrio tapetis subsp. tapetis TaxID=1671868 RepID=A0A2N8ZMC1_9VIBR|nr:hypothetical protein [Vibrio tapetis]SON53058.1 protein of unknown function [Vibrio tapetis subsp. tapetis]
MGSHKQTLALTLKKAQARCKIAMGKVDKNVCNTALLSRLSVSFVGL